MRQQPCSAVAQLLSMLACATVQTWVIDMVLRCRVQSIDGLASFGQKERISAGLPYSMPDVSDRTIGSS